jgi:peptide chain release factor subunit 1
MDYEILKLISQAEQVKGHGTQLISVYIRADSNVIAEAAKLKAEYTQADRIKSSQTRDSIKEGLMRIINKLKEYRDVKNGLVLLYGNENLLVYEPLAKLNVGRYSCDADFFLAPLYDMLKPQKTYCLCVMDGNESTIAMLLGSEVKLIKSIDSLVPSKTSKGGQSAARYERVREASLKEFFSKTAEVINREYLSRKFDYLIVGGAGFTKDTFIKEKMLNYLIKVHGIIDVGYTGEPGVKELINNAKDIFKDDEIAAQNDMLDRFKRYRMAGVAMFGGEAVQNLKKAKQVIISKEKIDSIDLSGVPDKDIFVMSAENNAGKEFLMGFAGIGIIL